MANCWRQVPPPRWNVVGLFCLSTGNGASGASHVSLVAIEGHGKDGPLSGIPTSKRTTLSWKSGFGLVNYLYCSFVSGAPLHVLTRAAGFLTETASPLTPKTSCGLVTCVSISSRCLRCSVAHLTTELAWAKRFCCPAFQMSLTSGFLSLWTDFEHSRSIIWSQQIPRLFEICKILYASVTLSCGMNMVQEVLRACRRKRRHCVHPRCVLSVLSSGSLKDAERPWFHLRWYRMWPLTPLEGYCHGRTATPCHCDAPGVRWPCSLTKNQPNGEDTQEWRWFGRIDVVIWTRFLVLYSTTMANEEGYHSARSNLERFWVFWELCSRFEFDFRRCETFFERFEFRVCSKFNHMQRESTFVCAVACLHPWKSILTWVWWFTITAMCLFLS